jgi:N-glycosylase/DNA lyase
MEAIKVSDFNLAATLECGQLFRYRKVSYGIGKNKHDEYVINYRDLIFRLRQEKELLYFSGVDKGFIISFFRLDENYRHIIKAISKDSFIRNAIKANYGMRIIRQDPWECLISYICSANNNIPRITSNVRMISKAFGKKLSDDDADIDGFAFPAPGRIDNHYTLKACKVGFRSRYIHEANRSVDELELIALKRKSYDYAKAELIRLKGVGEKIADCVCMFSLDKLEAFPVDVWIRRVMLEQYFKDRSEAELNKIKNSDIQEFARSYFGRYCGYANQFLFYYRRLQPRKTKKSG